MCGEKALSTFSSRKNSGSPPRMRGKVQPDADGCRPPGITPAYAGKRRAAKRYKRLLWDHPRVCGEKSAWIAATVKLLGSPPRVRGKVQLQPGQPAALGITPAYAGKSALYSASYSVDGDHPRVCGEKALSTFSSRKNSGSPPRMRGKVCDLAIIRVHHGITPACAGKSTPIIRMAADSRDHPRVCGEKPTQTAPTPVSPISSMARWVTRVPGPSSSTEMPADGI